MESMLRSKRIVMIIVLFIENALTAIAAALSCMVRLMPYHVTQHQHHRMIVAMMTSVVTCIAACITGLLMVLVIVIGKSEGPNSKIYKWVTMSAMLSTLVMISELFPHWVSINAR